MSEPLRRWAVDFRLGRQPTTREWLQATDEQRQQFHEQSHFVLDVRARNYVEAVVRARSDALAMASALLEWVKNPGRLLEAAPQNAPCRIWGQKPEEAFDFDETLACHLDYFKKESE